MVVVFPIGAAIAGGMCVLKAKSAWLFTAGEATAKKDDPWAPHVDLRDEGEKRKAAQRALEDKEEERNRKAEENRPFSIAEVFCLQSGIKSLSFGDPRTAVGRPLRGQGQAKHLGLHTTGSVFVRPIDFTNYEEFFAMGDVPFKIILVTGESETPTWLARFAGEHHSTCDFGEIRCTDGKMLQFFEIGPEEGLPVAIVASKTPQAGSFWRSEGGGVLRRMNLSSDSLFVVRSRTQGEEPSEDLLRKFMDHAVCVPGMQQDLLGQLRRPENLTSSAKWF